MKFNCQNISTAIVRKPTAGAFTGYAGRLWWTLRRWKCWNTSVCALSWNDFNKYNTQIIFLALWHPAGLVTSADGCYWADVERHLNRKLSWRESIRFDWIHNMYSISVWHICKNTLQSWILQRKPMLNHLRRLYYHF